MSGIIDDLLELSVHGKPVPGKVTVTPVVLELLDELRSELRDVEVKLELGDCTTACSANVLAQILRNLVTNATKYRSPNRGLELCIEAASPTARSSSRSPTTASAWTPRPRPTRSSLSTGRPARRHRAMASASRLCAARSQAVGGTVELTSTKGEGTRVMVRVPAA